MLTIKVTGLEQVMKKFERMPREFIEEMDKAVKKSAYLIEGESKKVTPVDTGHLRRSIWSTFSLLQAIIGPHVKYAIWVHEGHHQQVGRYVKAIGKRLVKPFVEGNPFMKRGVENVRDAVIKEFQKGIDILINK